MAGNLAKRPNGKWRARYRDESLAASELGTSIGRSTPSGGSTRSPRLSSRATTSTPALGKVTFKQFYDDWSKRQLWVPAIRANPTSPPAWCPPRICR